MMLHLLWFLTFIVHFVSSDFISEVRLEHLAPFPIELGSSFHWRISPTSGNAYDPNSIINIILDVDDIIGSWNTRCSSNQDKKDHMTICEVGEGPTLKLTFTPKREDFGRPLRIVFFPDIKSLATNNGQVLLNTTVQLIKHPKFLDLKVTIDREPDFVHLAPSELVLAPPVFLDGSMAKVECKTDGALPPQPIAFDIVCNNPPRAAVERERQAKAQLGYPYEVSYSYYNFRSPPTDEELAEQMAVGYAQGIMQESRIARSQDNLTLSATLPINSKAHDCSIYCRLMGKEQQYRLVVYYQTTVAYILPPPTDGLMRVGSSMTCYADGFPEPSIVLSLHQPMHQYSRRPIIDPRDYMVTTSPVPPIDQFVDTSDIAAATRIGLRPDEYTIRGPRFTLAYNATPGVELMLVCTAGNALPNAHDFLGSNKTIATARFTVAAIAYSSLGIVVGICLAILLLAIIIILLMVYLRRRQKYTSNAIRTRNSATVNAAGGANGAKVAGHGKQVTMSGSGDYVPGSKRLQSLPLLTNRKLHDLRSSLVSGSNVGDIDQESPYRGLLSRSPPATRPPVSNEGVEYAELAFNPTMSTLPPGNRGVPRKGIHGATTASTLGRAGSAGKLKQGPVPGPSSMSMQQLPRSHTQESEDGEGNYTEIIGVLQPKAYTSQLVLKQQQEATQAILGMHSNSPSVFV